MPVRCKKRGSKITIYGNNGKPATRGYGYPVRRKAGFESPEVPQDTIALRGAQTRAQRKAAKPTLPKMPWD